MSEHNKETLISSVRSENNAFNNTLKISVLFIILGIIGVFIGNFLAKQASSDSDSFFSILILGCGGVSVVGGIVLPFIEKAKAKIYHIDVFKSTIDGTGMVFTQGTTNGQILEFHENINNIMSVSSSKNLVVINLKDGRRIQCPADNAKEITLVIREEINQTEK